MAKLTLLLSLVVLFSLVLLVQSKTESSLNPSSPAFLNLLDKLVAKKYQLGDKWNPRAHVPRRIRIILKKLKITIPEKCKRRTNTTIVTENAHDLLDDIRFLSHCFSEKPQCPALNKDLKCPAGKKRVRKIRLVQVAAKQTRSCPYYECTSNEGPKTCPAIFTKIQSCPKGQKLVVRLVRYGPLDCKRNECVREGECPVISQANCPAGKKRLIIPNPKNKCPELACVPLACPKALLDSKTIRCRAGWTLKEQPFDYQGITCTEWRCTREQCPEEYKNTRNMKCKAGFELKKELKPYRGRKCSVYSCVPIECPAVDQAACKSDEKSVEVFKWHNGKLCSSRKCVHTECPDLATKECDSKTQQLVSITYMTESGEKCLKYDCKERQKICNDVCVRYQQEAGKCVKYEMRGEKTRCASWNYVASGQCLEKKITNKCLEYVPAGERCVKKRSVDTCIRKGQRSECVKYAQREICDEAGTTSTCKQFENRVIGCDQYKEVSTCAEWKTIPHASCVDQKVCLRKFPQESQQYCLGYERKCETGKREVCVTDTCACSKKPVKRCRTETYQACCKQVCKAFKTRTIAGRCAQWGTKKVCQDSKPQKVCARYTTKKVCAKPHIERLCTRWDKATTCQKRKVVNVCLTSRTTSYCAESTSKEVCEKYQILKTRCAKYEQQETCTRRSAGQKICSQYVSYGGEQVCVKKAETSICAEKKKICAYE